MDALNVKCNPFAWLKKNKCFCLLFALFKFVVLLFVLLTFNLFVFGCLVFVLFRALMRQPYSLGLQNTCENRFFHF